MKANLYLYKSFILLIILLSSCKERNSSLEQALIFANNNRPELEEVLQHYRSNPSDSLKYKAACFLIENMPGHFALDTAGLHLYRPILENLDSISNLSSEETNKMEHQWESLIQKHPFNKYLYKNAQADIHHIQAAFLIKDIDLSMEVWEENPYRDSISFVDFLEYVLPYRKYRRLAIEDWRSHFQKQHGGFLKKQYPQSIFSVVDSLLYHYRNFTHSVFILNDYPFMKTEDLLLARRSLCTERSWFNTMLLSSVGIPSAVDCVPAWANRHKDHTWNSILYKGTCYAFEPFWDKDRWKYKKLYNNVNEDEWWGAFRLPKVFRYTYVKQEDGPAFNTKLNREDIPPFFRNPDLKDVSQEYFTTQDITLGLRTTLNTSYAYLCVFNGGYWKPVQWGDYSKGQATFKKMGCGIVYLPAFYQNGTIIPAGSPFILHQDGSIKDLTISPEKENTVLTRLKSPQGRDKSWGKTLVGGKIQGANKANFSDATDLFTISEPIQLSIRFPVTETKKFRYIRFLFPNREMVPTFNPYNHVMLYGNIAEFSAYNENKVMTGKIIHGGTMDEKKMSLAFDNDWQTCIPYVKQAQKGAVWIGLDFDTPKQLSEIELATRNDQAFIYRGLTHELFYWGDNTWQSLGQKKATSDSLLFDNVPKNALLWLKCSNKELNERIFTYEDGKQVWY